MQAELDQEAVRAEQAERELSKQQPEGLPPALLLDIPSSEQKIRA